MNTFDLDDIAVDITDISTCNTEQNEVPCNKNIIDNNNHIVIPEEKNKPTSEEIIKKAEEERHKRDIEDLTIVVTILEQNMKRQSYYKNKITSGCIFLEKLLMTTDVVKAMLLTHYKNIPDDLNNRINVLVDSLNVNIESLINLIQK